MSDRHSSISICSIQPNVTHKILSQRNGSLASKRELIKSQCVIFKHWINITFKHTISDIIYEAYYIKWVLIIYRSISLAVSWSLETLQQCCNCYWTLERIIYLIRLDLKWWYKRRQKVKLQFYDKNGVSTHPTDCLIREMIWQNLTASISMSILTFANVNCNVLNLSYNGKS